jgi:hypothetical protein
MCGISGLLKKPETRGKGKKTKAKKPTKKMRGKKRKPKKPKIKHHIPNMPQYTT